MPKPVGNAITLGGTLIAMLLLEWKLTLLAIAILPIFVIPARRVLFLGVALSGEVTAWAGRHVTELGARGNGSCRQRTRRKRVEDALLHEPMLLRRQHALRQRVVQLA